MPKSRCPAVTRHSYRARSLLPRRQRDATLRGTHRPLGGTHPRRSPRRTGRSSRSRHPHRRIHAVKYGPPGGTTKFRPTHFVPFSTLYLSTPINNHGNIFTMFPFNDYPKREPGRSVNGKVSLSHLPEYGCRYLSRPADVPSFIKRDGNFSITARHDASFSCSCCFPSPSKTISGATVLVAPEIILHARELLFVVLLVVVFLVTAHELVHTAGRIHELSSYPYRTDERYWKFPSCTRDRFRRLSRWSPSYSPPNG